MGKGSGRRPSSVPRAEYDRNWEAAFGADPYEHDSFEVPDDFPDDWEWPEYPHPWQKEWRCPHGIGHGAAPHSCDGCCGHPSFPLNKGGDTK